MAYWAKVDLVRADGPCRMADTGDLTCHCWDGLKPQVQLTLIKASCIAS